MMSNDPDPKLQSVFNTTYAPVPLINWRQWLDITDIREYEALTLHLSGLPSVEYILDRIKNDRLQTISLRQDVSNDEAYNPSNPLVLCHSSGTSSQNLAAIKWYTFPRDLVSRLWAPGMQAIFESSGVSSRSHVAIFVPSRLNGDGLSVQAGNTIIRLYSSEFSQRLVLALLKPTQYFINHYRYSRSLSCIAQLLAMKHIEVLSAPATTILGWANILRLRRGLQRSIQSYSRGKLAELAESLEISTGLLEMSHLDALTQYIQERLQDVLASATLIFSTSSMSEADWTLLRTFMNWSQDNASYTNLYVGSEIGPLAASLRKKVSDPSNETMVVFPLAISMLQIDGHFQLLSRCPEGWGRLYIPKFQRDRSTVNIDVGDMIYLLPKMGYPRIRGTILRAAFPLKKQPVVSLPISLPLQFSISVGGYFSCNTCTIVDPQALRTCLAKYGFMTKRASLVLAPHPEDEDSWILFIPQKLQIDSLSDRAQRCLKEAIMSDLPELPVSIHFLSKDPIHPSTPRQVLARKVQQGKIPKGVLKRWPLYVIQADHDTVR
jgi:hypothetical protein